jgi:hypothetical protein
MTHIGRHAKITLQITHRSRRCPRSIRRRGIRQRPRRIARGVLICDAASAVVRKRRIAILCPCQLFSVSAGAGKLLHILQPPPDVEQAMFDSFFAPHQSTYNVQVPSVCELRITTKSLIISAS